MSPTKKLLSFSDGGGRIVRIVDERKGLTKEEYEAAERERENIVPAIAETSKFYRLHRGRPLLILKVLDVKHPEGIYESVCAFGVSFPSSESDRAVEYVFTVSALANQI